MRKFITYAIPIVLMAVFICIMLSGSFLKKPLGEDDDLPQLIDRIQEYVTNDSWEEANKGLEALDKAWKKVVVRVQFSSERDEINSINTSIARLRGAVQAKDKSNTLMELYEAYNHWKELGE